LMRFFKADSPPDKEEVNVRDVSGLLVEW